MGLVVIITSIKCTKLVVDRAGGDCYQGYGAGGDKNSITILGPVVIIPIIMANWHWRLVITKQQYDIKIVKNILYKNMILLNNNI